MKYEVQTAFVNSWENCWTEDDKLVRFDTLEEARAALEEEVKEQKEAAEAGDLVEPLTRDDFRIVQYWSDEELLEKVMEDDIASLHQMFQDGEVEEVKSFLYPLLRASYGLWQIRTIALHRGLINDEEEVF